MGHGTPPTAKALAHGLRPSLSIDVVTTVSGDMFTQMRFLFASDRLLVARGGVRRGRRDGARAPRPAARCSSSRRSRARASAGSRTAPARSRRASRRTSSSIRGDDTNTYPVIDPVSTVVLQADTRNVDTVFVAGRVLKRGGALVGADLRRARDRRGRLARLPAAAHEVQPHWVQARPFSPGNGLTWPV